MSRESKAHFGLPEYAPWTIAVNVTWMERGFNAGQTHRNEILVGDCHFSYPLAFIASVGVFPLGCSHWDSGKTFGPQKTRIMGLPGSEDSLMIG